MGRRIGSWVLIRSAATLAHVASLPHTALMWQPQVSLSSRGAC